MFPVEINSRQEQACSRHLHFQALGSTGRGRLGQDRWLQEATSRECHLISTPSSPSRGAPVVLGWEFRKLGTFGGGRDMG